MIYIICIKKLILTIGAKLNSTIKIKSKTQTILSDLYYYNINGTIFNVCAMKRKYIRISY